MIRFILLFLFLSAGIQASFDGEGWQSLNMTHLSNERWAVYSYVQCRFNREISKFYQFQFTESFAWHLHKFLDVEIHGTYIHEKSRSSLTFQNRYRLEIEANPHFKLKNGIFIELRNRFELIKHENTAEINKIARQKTKMTFPFKWGVMSGFYSYNEIFYHFNIHRFSQNRFSPLNLIIPLDQQRSWDFGVMLRNFLSGPKWYRSVVFTSNLIF